MSTKKLLVLLVVPIVIILATIVIALKDVGDAPTPRADAISQAVGIGYGLYAFLLTRSWWRSRRERAKS